MNYRFRIALLAVALTVDTAGAQVATLSAPSIDEPPTTLISRTPMKATTTAQLLNLLKSSELGQQALAAAAAANVPLSNTTTLASFRVSVDTMTTPIHFSGGRLDLYLSGVNVGPARPSSRITVRYPGLAYLSLVNFPAGWYVVSFDFKPFNVPNEAVGAGVSGTVMQTVNRCDSSSNAASMDASGVASCVALIQIPAGLTRPYLVTMQNTQFIEFVSASVTRLN